MPRPSFHGNKQQWQKGHQQDFHGGDWDKRRVTFKTNKFGFKKDNKDWSSALKEHLLEEDVDMGISSGSGRVIFKKFSKNNKGRHNSPLPGGRRKLFEGPSNWYKVSIPHGAKYDKSFLLKTLLDKISPMPLLPIAWQIAGQSSVFYIDDYKTADKLNNLDRQIQLPSGFTLHIRVYPGSPNVDMNQNVKDKMKLAMAKRYNSATKALDLTKFHADPELQNYFCAIFKPIVFLTVLDIIAENIPELEALNLFENRINVLSYIKNPTKKIPNLKILHIGKNKIADIAQLDSLQELPIVELVLDGNPLCDKFKDQTTYISEVRKRFPKCMKLDGIDLPAPIGFDIAEEHHLPNASQTFLCNSEGSGIVRQFLEEYFRIYDSDNRQNLLDAYHENSSFSLTMDYPYGYGKDKSVPWLNWYATDNRNLLRLKNPERRMKLLKQGRLSVVSFLKDMPQTKHDIHSFSVDLTLFTPQMLCLTVAGMFKELKSGHKVPPLRYFFKTLLIVPAGSGFCICNEMLHVSNATPDQAKEAFKTQVNTVSIPTSTIPSTSPGPSTVQPTAIVPDATTKQEMVKQMSAQSGMNLEWSFKCLEESQWDFQRATLVFQNLHAQGVVPAEAFVK